MDTKKYRIEVTENGTVLNEFDSYEDAKDVLEFNENEDKADGNFELGYYTISKLNEETGEYEGIYDSKHGFYGEEEE